MAIDNYLNLITSQHKTQPKFIAWLSAALQKVDDGISMTNSIPSSFDVDTAVGVQLDVIGKSIGVSRDVGIPLTNTSSILDDSHYRTVLKAKIASNQWDGTVDQIYEIWSNAFPGSQLQIIDNQDMTMQAQIVGMTDNLSLELVSAGLIIPKPAGVKMTIVIEGTMSDTSTITDSVTSIVTTQNVLYGSGRKWGQALWN